MAERLDPNHPTHMSDLPLCGCVDDIDSAGESKHEASVVTTPDAAELSLLDIAAAPTRAPSASSTSPPPTSPRTGAIVVPSPASALDCSPVARAGPSSSCPDFEVSVAPMMEWTYRQYRYFMRMLTRRTILYTEMVCDDTLVWRKDAHGSFLGFDDCEHPIVAQLGGNRPETLGDAAALCETFGYDEVNINVGGPSTKVSRHEFGARLMYKPELVRDITYEMRRRVQIPVTVKCRLGVDCKDTYEDLCRFVDIVSCGGRNVTHFIIHARKCMLNGISTAANRRIPPIRYDWVIALARQYPHLDFTLNGGVNTLDECRAFRDVPLHEPTVGVQPVPLDTCSAPPAEGMGWAEAAQAAADAGAVETRPRALRGVMIGRAAAANPWQVFSDIDRVIFGEPTNVGLTRRDIVRQYVDYAEEWAGGGPYGDKYRVPAIKLAKPLTNLFKGEPAGKEYRRILQSELQIRKGKPPSDVRTVFEKATAAMHGPVLDAPPGTATFRADMFYHWAKDAEWKKGQKEQQAVEGVEGVEGAGGVGGVGGEGEKGSGGEGEQGGGRECGVVGGGECEAAAQEVSLQNAGPPS